MVMSNLASKGYATVEEYVQDVFSKIERKDPTLTTLQIDDLHYPMGDLDGGDYLDSETIAKLLTQAQQSPYIDSLELRFVPFDDQVSQAFQAFLTKDPTKNWESISVTACSGLTSDDFCALASVLDHCHTLHWHHNKTCYDGLGTLGMSLASSTSLQVLHLTRETLKKDSAHALLDALSSNTHLIKLVLNFCRFDDSGIDALADALVQNSYLQELDLGACYLNDRQVERVVLALRRHPTLRKLVLTLNGCHVRGAHAMAKLLQQPHCPLEYLNLSHQQPQQLQQQNDTGDSSDTIRLHVQPIAKALVVNTSLRWLRLSRNHLKCNDVRSLFYALRTNQTLRMLDLNSNAIDDQGVAMLASALSRMQGLCELHLLKNDNIRSPQSSLAILQALRQSNRTLEILELRPSMPYRSLIQYELALNAGGRRILSDCMTNKVPLGLWPRLLERTSKTTTTTTTTTPNDSTGSYYQPDVMFYLLQASALLSQR